MATKKDLRKELAQLGGTQPPEDANYPAIADAVKAAKAAAASSSAGGDPPDGRNDDDVRAEDRARVGGGPIAANDAVERRAIGSGTVVRNRRPTIGEGAVERAATRGVYLDGDNRPRIVGAGQPVPPGWKRIESATVEDRIGNVPTAADAVS